MYTAKGKRANACLAQLRKPLSHKTAVALMGRDTVKEVTRLDKKICTLFNGKIGCLLKGEAQPLLPFFAFARLLPKGGRAEMIIGGQYNSNSIIVTLLLVSSI